MSNIVSNKLIKGVRHIVVKPLLSDSPSLDNSKVKPSQIQTFITYDANVYDEHNNLILLFRKKKINPKVQSDFYDNIIQFALTPTSNRGTSSGTKVKRPGQKKILTNIIGYFDNLSVRQRHILKKNGSHIDCEVRETVFVRDHPEQYREHVVPYVQAIDKLYKQYVPEHYRKQRAHANQTPFVIDKTAFSTVTVNVNFTTTMHKDSGDDPDGFGNLSVFEHGEYEGGETCLPTFGIGVDVRSGDICFMDVHQFHGNLPIKPKTKDAKRLSVVCYLRTKIYEKTKGMTQTQKKKHIEKLNRLLKKTAKKK